MTDAIHSTAIVSAEAKIGENVKIGPFCIVGPQVELGDGTVLNSHVVMDGILKVGKNNQFFQFCSIGAPPQDTGYKGGPTRVEIGDNNIFRESCTVHRGTTKQDMATIIGSNSLFMSYVHIGHDVTVGDHCVIVNSVNFAGHVKVGDRCIIGGGTNVSQFVTLGNGAYIGGATAIDRDVPTFCTAYGNRVRLKGINIIGMRRQGYQRQEISEVIDFYRTMEASALSPRSFIDREDNMKDVNMNNSIINSMVEHIRSSEIGIAPFPS